MLRCAGCGEWDTAGHLCEVYYRVCDCGTITTVFDFADKSRAIKQIERKKWKNQIKEWI